MSAAKNYANLSAEGGMRRLSLSVSGLSCETCVAAVKKAIIELLSSSQFPSSVPPIVDLNSRSAAVVIPPDISNSQVISAISSLGFGKSARITSSELAWVPTPSGRDSLSRQAKRFRCGCSNVSCCCSKVPVLPGDTGILVTVVINDRLISPGFPTIPVTSSCGSCSCMFTEVCSCSTDTQKNEQTRKSTTSLSDELVPIPTVADRSTDDALKGSVSVHTPNDAQDGSDLTHDVSQNTVVRKAFVISGMTCASCAGIVTDILTSVRGVQDATVSALTARAVLAVSKQEFNVDEAVQVLKTKGYDATEVKDLKTDDRTVFLRFSTRKIAERACQSLNNSKVVVRASLWDPSARNQDMDLSDATSGRKGDGNDMKYPESPHLIRKLAGSCHSFWPSNSVKPLDAEQTILRIESTDKLEVLRQLQSHSLQYETISGSDPVLSGTLDTSELLQVETRKNCYLFLGSLMFTLPLALLTMVISKIPALGGESLKAYVGGSGFRVVDIIAWVLATPVQFFFGFGFYRRSWYALRLCRANMDVLIALGTTVAYVFSVIVPILKTIQIQQGGDTTLEGIAFETSSLLITIVLFGKWMENITKKRTAAGVEALANLAPRKAIVVSPPPNTLELFSFPVDVEFVSSGNFVKVNPGAAFPVDGIVVQGQTCANETMLTGESTPVAKSVDDEVFGGSVNVQNPVIVRCTSCSSESMLEAIVDLVKRAQEARAPIEAFADVVSAYFVPVVVFISVAATSTWISLATTRSIPSSWYESEGSVVFGVLFGLAVLVIACPCALGLATPTVVMVATSLGARKFGILFKDGGEALQAARNVDTILFDKTGTLTEGRPAVTNAFPLDLHSSDANPACETNSSAEIDPRIMKIFAVAESYSDHPLAQAIMEYHKMICPDQKTDLVLSDHELFEGCGIRCRLKDGRKVDIGNPSWVISGNALRLASSSQQIIDEMEESGKTIVLAIVTGENPIAFCIEDPVRQESASAVAFFQSRGIKCGVVTGDGRGTALNVARKLNIEDNMVYSRVLPAEKMNIVKRAQASSPGRSVVFVGDGINDSAALSAASVGIAMGSGAQIASENAGIVLAKSHLWDVVVALDLAHVAFRRLKINYVWALGFNTLGIPVAAGALYPAFNTRIPPFAAAVAMALSSIMVVLSSLALNLYRPPTNPAFHKKISESGEEVPKTGA